MLQKAENQEVPSGGPQTLGTAFDKLVAQVNWLPGLVQPCAMLYFL